MSKKVKKLNLFWQKHMNKGESLNFEMLIHGLGKKNQYKIWRLRPWGHVQVLQYLGKPLLEMWWFYMGIAQIAIDPPPSVKQASVEKSAPNHPGKPFHPRETWGKKVP